MLKQYSLHPDSARVLAGPEGVLSWYIPENRLDLDIFVQDGRPRDHAMGPERLPRQASAGIQALTPNRVKSHCRLSAVFSGGQTEMSLRAWRRFPGAASPSASSTCPCHEFSTNCC